jgi:hypothetical protein
MVSWESIRRSYISLLENEGFRPEVDAEGDIHFKYEGGHYYITSNCDDTYFHMLYPGFWSIDGRNELLAALLAANSINKTYKAAKVLINKDGDKVSATLEAFIAQPSDARIFLRRALRCVQGAVDDFGKEMRGMRE